VATDFERAKVLDFHAAACADALQRFPELHPDVRQYLGLAILGEYPMDTPTDRRIISRGNLPLQMLICSGPEGGFYIHYAGYSYCRELRRQGVELPAELKHYYERQ